MLFYVDAFWPKKLKEQLAELEEIAVPVKLPSCGGLNATAIFKFVAVLLMLVGTTAVYIVPQVRVLHSSVCSCSVHILVLWHRVKFWRRQEMLCVV